jgi:putative two-component system response regulator
MGSSHTHDLTFLLRDHLPDRSEVRPHLLRVASAVEERVRSVDASSIEFVRTAVSVLKKVGPSYDPELQYQCFSSAVPYLYAHAELDAALLAASGMVAIGNYTNRKHLIRRGVNYLGIIDKTLGNFADAVVHFREALALAQELDDIHGEVSVLGNLAGAFVEAALYREALPCFQRAEALCVGRLDLTDAQAMNLVNLSHLFLRMGDIRQAYEAAERSIKFWEEPKALNDYVSRTLRKAHYVYLNLELGNVNVAQGHASDCQRYAQKNPTAPSVFFAKISSGLIHVALGEASTGLEILEAARDDARRLRQTSFMDDAWIALAWAYERLRRPEDALQCLRSLRHHMVERRRLAVAALLDRTSVVSDESSPDFLAMNYREAKLQAEVLRAERCNAQVDLLQRLATAATLRDDPSGLHGHRVGRLSALLAAKLGWNPRQCWSLEISARLHDIGKSGLPDHILLSRDALKEAERDFVKAHSSIGHALLSNAPSKELAEAAEVALYHHERWDGSGYPKGLVGARIPIAARIVAITDVFDALTHGRPYSEPWPIDRALSEIHELSGRHFDPQLCELFVDMIARLQAAHPDLDAFLTAGSETSPFMTARRQIERMIRAGAPKGLHSEPRIP